MKLCMQRKLQEIYNANKTYRFSQNQTIESFILLLFFLAKLIFAKLGQTSKWIKWCKKFYWILSSLPVLKYISLFFEGTILTHIEGMYTFLTFFFLHSLLPASQKAFQLLIKTPRTSILSIKAGLSDQQYRTTWNRINSGRASQKRW